VREGAKVAIFGRSRKTLDEAVHSLGENAIGIQGDVTSFDDLDRLYATTQESYGNIDVLFINAGSQSSPRSWRRANKSTTRSWTSTSRVLTSPCRKPSRTSTTADRSS